MSRTTGSKKDQLQDTDLANTRFEDLNDANITGLAEGDALIYLSSNFNNRPTNDGQIKVNSFDTNIQTGIKPTFIGLTTSQDVEYQFPAETHVQLNASGFPTTSVAHNQGGVYSDALFYTNNGGAGADRFIQNPVLGGIAEYRIQYSWSNKTVNNAGRILITISNPLSGFTAPVAIPLAAGTTLDSGIISITTISDSANLPPPFGTGAGYKISVQSTTSLDLVIDSITRIDRYHSARS